MRFWKALAIVTAVVGVIAIPVAWFMVAGWFEEAARPEPWPKQPHIVVALPDKAGTFELFMRDTHPIKPKFERRIAVNTRDGRRLSSLIYFHYHDPTKIRLYWYAGDPPAGPILRIEDKCAEIIVHLGEEWIEGLSRAGSAHMVPPSGFYLSDWDAMKGSIQLLDRKTGRVVLTRPARPVPNPVATGEGAYLGLIAGRGHRLTYIPHVPSGTPISPDWPPFDKVSCPLGFR